MINAFVWIRYPDDVYDRQWMPLLFDSWIPIATNLTICSQGNDNTYKLPAAVLRTAAKTPNATTALNIYWNTSHSLSKFYVYFHFAEIEMLGAGQQRELNITLNNERNLRESVKLDYLHPLTIVQNDPPTSGSQIKLSINAAGATMFPPILNAFEIFALKELPNKPTAIGDGTYDFFYDLIILYDFVFLKSYFKFFYFSIKNISWRYHGNQGTVHRD